jgi:hypothetical protein
MFSITCKSQVSHCFIMIPLLRQSRSTNAVIAGSDSTSSASEPGVSSILPSCVRNRAATAGRIEIDSHWPTASSILRAAELSGLCPGILPILTYQLSLLFL